MPWRTGPSLLANRTPTGTCSLFAVVTLTVRDGLVLKIEATADPGARGL
ncbi:hypothetical protein HNP40_001766 [Mycobacteroides chelonae]|nr:hypothetical protein [Mycobacteroides chelonae]